MSDKSSPIPSNLPVSWDEIYEEDGKLEGNLIRISLPCCV